MMLPLELTALHRCFSGPRHVGKLLPCRCRWRNASGTHYRDEFTCPCGRLALEIQHDRPATLSLTHRNHFTLGVSERLLAALGRAMALPGACWRELPAAAARAHRVLLLKSGYDFGINLQLHEAPLHGFKRCAMLERDLGVLQGDGQVRVR